LKEEERKVAYPKEKEVQQSSAWAGALKGTAKERSKQKKVR